MSNVYRNGGAQLTHLYKHDLDMQTTNNTADTLIQTIHVKQHLFVNIKGRLNVFEVLQFMLYIVKISHGDN